MEEFAEKITFVNPPTVLTATLTVDEFAKFRFALARASTEL
jgi:hypothetical protein